MTDLATNRRLAGISQNVVAARAGVSPLLVRMFEKGGPSLVADERKRAALEAVYATFQPAQAPSPNT